MTGEQTWELEGGKKGFFWGGVWGGGLVQGKGAASSAWYIGIQLITLKHPELSLSIKHAD